MKRDNEILGFKKKTVIISSSIIGAIVLLWILLVSIQVPYTAQVSYTEQEPYQSIEYYNEQVSTSGCDGAYGCYCLHQSWFGLGACDSCNCERQRTVTNYRTVTKTREETRYCNLWKKVGGVC